MYICFVVYLHQILSFCQYINDVDRILRRQTTITMCIEYQLHPPTDPLFYVTNVAFPPIIFVVGMVCNVLLLVIFNRRSLRRDSAISVSYTHLTLPTNREV